MDSSGKSVKLSASFIISKLILLYKVDFKFRNDILAFGCCSAKLSNNFLGFISKLFDESFISFFFSSLFYFNFCIITFTCYLIYLVYYFYLILYKQDI